MEQLLHFAFFMVISTAVTGILAISLNIQFGFAGLVNFGQVLYLGIGGYVAALLFNAGFHPILCILGAAAISGAAGYLMSFTVRDLSGTYWGIVTICVAELFRLFVNNEAWFAGGANGISLERRVPSIDLMVIGWAIAAFLISLLIYHSPFGRTLRLLREGNSLPLSLGKDVGQLKLKCMSIGGMLGGVAGALYALLNGYMSPEDCTPIETFIVWAMVIVGGSGSVWGVVVGTAAVQFLYVGSRFLTNFVEIPGDTLAALRLVLIGMLITVMMMYRPLGLLPEKKRVYKL